MVCCNVINEGMADGSNRNNRQTDINKNKKIIPKSKTLVCAHVFYHWPMFTVNVMIITRTMCLRARAFIHLMWAISRVLINRIGRFCSIRTMFNSLFFISFNFIPFDFDYMWMSAESLTDKSLSSRYIYSLRSILFSPPALLFFIFPRYFLLPSTI